MKDIEFDIVNREIVLSYNDFATELNPSVQNGGIMLNSRAANVEDPMAGIGLEEVINADMAKLTYEMNRWAQMCIDDGATLARWNIEKSGSDALIAQEVSYV